MTHCACHSFLAPLPALALNTSPENFSDGPMIYLMHADVFCIKTWKMLQCTLLVERLLRLGVVVVESRFGCIILSEYFLHLQFCFTEDGRAVDSKQGGRREIHKCWKKQQISSCLTAVIDWIWNHLKGKLSVLQRDSREHKTTAELSPIWFITTEDFIIVELSDTKQLNAA